jgi:hypothetical protein
MHALADGELSAEERKQAEDHRATCPDCRAEYTAVDSLKIVLRTRLEVVEAQESWVRCRRRLDEMDRAKHVESFVTRYAWGFCSLFIFIILSAATWNHVMRRHSVQTGDLPQMTAGLIPMGAPRSQQPEAMRQWVESVSPGTPVYIPRQTMQVVGGAYGLNDGHRIMRLDLLDQFGPTHGMRLIVISDVQAIDGLEKLDSSGNYYAGKLGTLNCVAWSSNNNALLLLGDRPVGDLCAVADAINEK